jgi:hypothetical protein
MDIESMSETRKLSETGVFISVLAEAASAVGAAPAPYVAEAGASSHPAIMITNMPKSHRVFANMSYT